MTHSIGLTVRKPPVVAALVLLVAFCILPAWRPQIFGTDYNHYYAARAVLFVVLAALFYVCARGFSADLSTGDTSSVRTGYGDPLLSLRAFACAIVLIGHGAAGLFSPTDVAWQATESRTFWLLFPMPWSGVWIFFTLSGYLMGKAFFTGRYQFSRDDILRFYRNRLLRLMPLAYFAIAIIVLFTRPDAIDGSNIKYLLALLLFDYDGTSPLSLIGLLWSIATEMQFYLIAPYVALGLAYACRRVSPLVLGVTLLVLGVGYRLLCLYFLGKEGWIFSVYTPLLGNLDIFLVGMLASLTVQQSRLTWPRISYGLCAMAVVYVLGCLCWSHLLGPHSEYFTAALMYLAPTIVAVMTVAIIILFENAARAESKPHPFARRLIISTQLFGTLTYAIYLWHAPIFEAYAKTLIKPISSNQTVAALAIASALVFGFAYVTYRLIEKPFDDLKRSGAPAG